MTERPSLIEKLKQWDQIAVIALVIVLSQLAAVLWLDAHRDPAPQAAAGSASVAAQPPPSSR